MNTTMEYISLPMCLLLIFIFEFYGVILQWNALGVEADLDVYHTNVHAFDEFLYV